MLVSGSVHTKSGEHSLLELLQGQILLFRSLVLRSKEETA